MEREINKVSFLKNPKREKTKFFCKKIFVFSLRRPARGSSQREKEIFFAKKFLFLSFRDFSIMILYLFHVPLFLLFSNVSSSITIMAFFERTYKPFLQTTVVLSASLAGLFLLKAYSWMTHGVDPMLYWIIVGTFLLFYALFNSILSLNADDITAYWSQSTGGYAVLLMISSGCAWLLSGKSIGEADSFRWIFMVLTFGYLLFLCITRFVRKIVRTAQREDQKWVDRTK